MTDHAVDFRKIIIDAIKESNKTIPYWAAQAGINPGTLYNYLKGKSQMTTANLEKLMSALKISL